MLPTRDSNGTLVDLLDRLLDKGVVLNLDLIIGVANIPLIGLRVHAFLAAVETMLEYGLMEEWDSRIRSHARVEHGFEKTQTEGVQITGDPPQRG